MSIFPEIKKILIIRLRFTGDVLLTTPVIRTLRLHFPNAYIVYLTEKLYEDVLSGNPNLNKVLTLDFKSKFLSQIKLIRKIRKEKFDLIIDLFCNPRSALIVFLSGAKYRLGGNYRGRRYAYNIIFKGNATSAIDGYLNMLAEIGITSFEKELYFPLTAQSENFSLEFLKQNNINPDNLIVGLNPGASHPSKQWSYKKFAQLAEILINKYKAQIIIFEGPKEKGLSDKIAKIISHKVNVVKNINLKQLASIIKKCKVFITNDAGPMHISVAVGTKTIALFGQGEPEIWFPYNKKDGYIALQKKVDCSPCHLDNCDKESHRCMDLLTVDEVIESFSNILKLKC